MSECIQRIKDALKILKTEIKSKQLTNISINIDKPKWICIKILSEGRQVWLSYLEDNGYFLSWDKKTKASPFFNLDNNNISDVLSFLPSIVEKKEDFDTEKMTILIEQINSNNPDKEKVKKIFDKIPVTIEGIDIFATIACIKKYKQAVEKLKVLINSKAAIKEKEYQKIISLHPWMLGSQYNEVLKEEFIIWFDSRVDLLLCNAMGHIDIVELKRPDMNILIQSKHPKTWRNSVELSNAYAQALKYLRILDERRYDIIHRLSLQNQSFYRLYRANVIIVIGRIPSNSDALQALRDINTENSRILILTYDDVLSVAEATINLFEKRLLNQSLLSDVSNTM